MPYTQQSNDQEIHHSPCWKVIEEANYIADEQKTVLEIICYMGLNNITKRGPTIRELSQK